jgi:REP element-mobilizing transposase RayT
MPVDPIYLENLEPGKCYHIYNRTNNKELLFRCEENKRYFMQQADYYLSGILDLYGWCLLSNHFHFCVKMKERELVCKYIEAIPPAEKTITEIKFLNNSITTEMLAAKTFTRFFQSFSNSFNKMYLRKGNLFHKPFKRVWVRDDEQFRKSLVYIHTNPIKHGLTHDFENYQWSSWSEYMKKNSEIKIIKEVFQKFGGKAAFIAAHQVHQSFLGLPTLEGWQPYFF